LRAPEGFDAVKQRLAPGADVETGKSTIQDVPLSPRGFLIALVGIAVTIGLATYLERWRKSLSEKEFFQAES
jgi:hypothetical protein